MGTIEEAIYKRQVNKISLSNRIVDNQQMVRQFKRHDLTELYSIDNIEPVEKISNHVIPDDQILAQQLEKFDYFLHDYHYHDSLLQNEDDNLSLEEMKLAWDEYNGQTSGTSSAKNMIEFSSLLGNIITQTIISLKKRSSLTQIK